MSKIADDQRRREQELKDGFDTQLRSCEPTHVTTELEKQLIAQAKFHVRRNKRNPHKAPPAIFGATHLDAAGDLVYSNGVRVAHVEDQATYNRGAMYVDQHGRLMLRPLNPQTQDRQPTPRATRLSNSQPKVNKDNVEKILAQVAKLEEQIAKANALLEELNRVKAQKATNK